MKSPPTPDPKRAPARVPPANRGDKSGRADPANGRRPWTAVAQVFVLVTVGTLAVEFGGRALGLEGYTHVTLAALFLTVAVQAAQRTPGGLAAHGLWLGGLLEPPTEPSPGALGGVLDLLTTLRQAMPSALRETGVALATAALTFPPFVAGFYLYHQPQHGFNPQAFAAAAPVDSLLSQLLVVALPEEALFRGYIQSQLMQHFPSRFRWPVTALLIQAALFAILHFVVNLDPVRLAVFFPGLLFGVLRVLRGGIGAALVYHALCNLLGEVLVRGFL